LATPTRRESWQWPRLRHYQRRGWFGLGAQRSSALITTAADAHVEATFSKTAESAETAEIMRRPEEVVATATSTMTAATATGTVAAATRDEMAPMAVQTKKMAEQTEESYLFVLLFCFLFSGDRRSWLLLSLVETSADNVFRVEVNDPTTEPIPLTIEVYIQGERTQVESRVRSGGCVGWTKQPHKRYYKRRIILLIIQLNKS
jgi:hypothetical protein